MCVPLVQQVDTLQISLIFVEIDHSKCFILYSIVIFMSLKVLLVETFTKKREGCINPAKIFILSKKNSLLLSPKCFVFLKQDTNVLVLKNLLEMRNQYLD